MSRISATCFNDKTGAEFTDVCGMVKYYAGSDESCDRTIFTPFPLDITGEIKQILLNDVRIGKYLMVVCSRSDFGNYRYVLEK